MYSIGSQKRKIKNTNTGGVTYINSSMEKHNPLDDFALANENIYDEVGTLINEAANPKDYDLAFAIKLRETYPLYKCSDLLYYHFDKTENKEQYLNHIEFHILLFTFLKDEQPEKFEYIKTWVKEMSKLLDGLRQQKEFNIISESHDLEYYTSANFLNQNLVLETIQYFETGERKELFKPIDFMNLLWHQYNFVKDYVKGRGLVVVNLKALPLSELEKHVLFGFILKWFGGYPVNNLNEDLNATLKLIEKEFLGYKGETPEKKFCRLDSERQKHFIRLGIALTTAINNNVNATDIFNAMQDTKPQTQIYNSFDILFEDVAQVGVFGKFENNLSFLQSRSLYNFNFNIWLQETKNWEYGNKSEYDKHLTKATLLEYLEYENANTRMKNFYNGISSEAAFKIFQENYNKLREQFRVKREATKEDCAKISGLKEGDIIEYNPEYKTTIEAFNILTKYYAAAYLELEKFQFYEKYKVWNIETIKSEIIELEKFINAAKAESLSEACKAFNSFPNDKPEFIYRRFCGGFYENLEVEKYPLIGLIGNPEACVYGKYFLFYEFLKTQLNIFASQQKAINTECVQQNNEPLKSIDKYLSPLKEAFNTEADYLKAIETVNSFFCCQKIKINSALFVKNGNIRRLAFALGEIWRSQKNEIITYNYLKFYKQVFSIFKGQALDKDNLFSNNLYKYSISKT